MPVSGLTIARVATATIEIGDARAHEAGGGRVRSRNATKISENIGFFREQGGF